MPDVGKKEVASHTSSAFITKTSRERTGEGANGQRAGLADIFASYFYAGSRYVGVTRLAPMSWKGTFAARPFEVPDIEGSPRAIYTALSTALATGLKISAFWLFRGHAQYKLS